MFSTQVRLIGEVALGAKKVFECIEQQGDFSFTNETLASCLHRFQQQTLDSCLLCFSAPQIIQEQKSFCPFFFRNHKQLPPLLFMGSQEDYQALLELGIHSVFLFSDFLEKNYVSYMLNAAIEEHRHSTLFNKMLSKQTNRLQLLELLLRQPCFATINNEIPQRLRNFIPHEEGGYVWKVDILGLFAQKKQKPSALQSLMEEQCWNWQKDPNARPVQSFLLDGKERFCFWHPFIFQNETIGFYYALRSHSTFFEDDLEQFRVFLQSISFSLIQLIKEAHSQRTELTYRALFENSTDVIFLSTPSGKLLDINMAGVDLFGYSSKEELLELDAHELYVDDSERHIIQKMLEEQGYVKNHEFELKRKDGSHLFVSESTRAVYDEKGVIIAFRGIIRDITDKKMTETALLQSEERYAAVLEGTQDGLWDWDLEKNTLFFSPRWKEMLGYLPSEIGNTPEDWFSLVDPADLESLKRSILLHRQGKNDHLDVEIRMFSKTGETRWMLCRGLLFRNEANQPLRMAGSLYDITERKKTEEQLRYNALHDSLTGLPNRVLFVQKLQEAMEKEKEMSKKFAVLFLDMDGFKQVNDTMGHNVGDKLLVAVAGRIRNCLRSGDIAARFGGDEFAFLLEDIRGIQDASMASERILNALQKPFLLDKYRVEVNASIGIALSNEEYQNAEEILQDADSEMYRVKVRGDGGYSFRFSNSEEQRHSQKKQQIKEEIEKAFERNEFTIEFQSIYNLQTLQPERSEAVVLWNHPKKGKIRAEKFFFLAKESGFGARVGWWAMDHIFQQLKESPPKHLPCYLHLAPDFLTSHDFFLNLDQRIEKYGVDLNSFFLEIPEHLLFEKQQTATGFVQKLRERNIRICLSKVGLGALSLRDLLAFDPASIKLAPSLLENERNKFLQLICSLTTTLKIELVACGIQTSKHFNDLQKQSCFLGKGDFFTKKENKP